MVAGKRQLPKQGVFFDLSGKSASRETIQSRLKNTSTAGIYIVKP
jgi:hypothetical protein